MTYYDFKIAVKKRIQPYYNSFFYKSFGKKSIVDSPLLVRNKKRIQIGNNVTIRKASRIEVVDKYGDKIYNPQLIIEDNTTIEFNFHISCAHQIHIENDVLIAGNVTIVDNNHSYENINVPIQIQPLSVSNGVRIGSHTFVGMGARIMPGVNIGRHCVVGANSVVTKDIPDYCVVAGVPAKIIKKYNLDKSQWEKYS